MEELSQIPSFGSWHYSFGEEDLFQVPVAMPVNSADHYGHHSHKKARNQKNDHDFAAQMPWRSRAPKAVDEDLYKIPQELLYQKPKRKRLMRNLLSGCLGLSCIP